MEKIQNTRLFSALKTPYTCTGRIDLNALDRMVSFQIEKGVEGLVLADTIGEGHLMNWDERLGLIEHCANLYGG